jgi:hypothetical protein
MSLVIIYCFDPLKVNPKSASVESAGFGASRVSLSFTEKDTAVEKVTAGEVPDAENTRVPMEPPFFFMVKVEVAFAAVSA